MSPHTCLSLSYDLRIRFWLSLPLGAQTINWYFGKERSRLSIPVFHHRYHIQMHGTNGVCTCPTFVNLSSVTLPVKTNFRHNFLPNTMAVKHIPVSLKNNLLSLLKRTRPHQSMVLLELKFIQMRSKICHQGENGPKKSDQYEATKPSSEHNLTDPRSCRNLNRLSQFQQRAR